MYSSKMSTICCIVLSINAFMYCVTKKSIHQHVYGNEYDQTANVFMSRYFIAVIVRVYPFLYIISLGKKPKNFLELSISRSNTEYNKVNVLSNSIGEEYKWKSSRNGIFAMMITHLTYHKNRTMSPLDEFLNNSVFAWSCT
ncbi:hypothetical protein BDB01DRAFT_831503 [Pilobolus umbonatus]|nr:hypothetical protein BDB01DRAFT_831503 [Pilobolus umbonatus]